MVGYFVLPIYVIMMNIQINKLIFNPMRYYRISK